MRIQGGVLVLCQLVGIGVVIWAAYAMRSSAVSLVAISTILCGGALAVATLLHNRLGNFSIHPEPRKHALLITTGPYKWIRHPMYLSVILGLFGIAWFAGHVLGWIGFALATMAMIGKTFLEEKYLSVKFPTYQAYKSQTKRLIPYLF